MPAANSGSSSPLSAASAASLRMADIRMMIEEDPRPRASSETRQALTVALLKPGRGASLNQAINSSRAMLYTRRVIGEETLSSTSAFNRSHSAAFSTKATSFIFLLLLGINGSHLNITSACQRHQAKRSLSRQRLWRDIEILRKVGVPPPVAWSRDSAKQSVGPWLTHANSSKATTMKWGMPIATCSDAVVLRSSHGVSVFSSFVRNAR